MDHRSLDAMMPAQPNRLERDGINAVVREVDNHGLSGFEGQPTPRGVQDAISDLPDWVVHTDS
jgi:hypothetical protein